ncbi:hypothetical protein AB0J86_12785 [Micromonospora sp. NPDC049559]|uniref:TlpA family protein disulfide reductase n=1 Tax=Micromonospora sp. NPDC049559 TaxID=3155923 RepID=UPI003426809F
MPYVVAALVLVGIVAGLNLLLTVGVIRRLREHTETLRQVRSGTGSSFLPAGSPLPALTGVTTVTGTPVVAPAALVAFFSTTCAPCREKLPSFRDHVRAAAVNGSDVLVVVEGAADDASEFVAALRDVGQVVVEPELGPVAKSFAVNGFPTFYALGPDGRVLVGTHEVAELPVPATP